MHEAELSQPWRGFCHENGKLSWEAATPETLKQIMQIIHCNVKPRYQQSRLPLRYQIFHY